MNLRVVVSKLPDGEVTEILEITVSDVVSAGHQIAEFVQDLNEPDHPPHETGE